MKRFWIQGFLWFLFPLEFIRSSLPVNLKKDLIDKVIHSDTLRLKNGDYFIGQVDNGNPIIKPTNSSATGLGQIQDDLIYQIPEFPFLKIPVQNTQTQKLRF